MVQFPEGTFGRMGIRTSPAGWIFRSVDSGFCHVAQCSPWRAEEPRLHRGERAPCSVVGLIPVVLLPAARDREEAAPQGAGARTPAPAQVSFGEQRTVPNWFLGWAKANDTATQK